MIVAPSKAFNVDGVAISALEFSRTSSVSAGMKQK